MVAITALISTYNRADYLERVLESFVEQTLSRDAYEIVLINDGSVDGTEAVVEKFSPRLPVRYFFHENRGLAASKNRGIEEAGAPIVVFVDDDDLVAPDFLEEHIRAHQKFPGDNYAVLGYTRLDEQIINDPLMDYVTEVDCFLFSYPSLQDGDVLDYTYFWGGRTSCKVDFLKKYGVFNPVFKFGCEDIELGYRLSSHSLKVVYHRAAQSIMIRRLSVDDFFSRLLRQGRSQRVFSDLHEADEIQRWCEVKAADSVWSDIELVFDELLMSARNLNGQVDSRLQEGLGVDGFTLQLLHRAYGNAFKACKIKGIVST